MLPCTSLYVTRPYHGPPRQHSVADKHQVKVGHDNLVGEVIRISADKATIQVYEETGKQYLAYPGALR